MKIKQRFIGLGLLLLAAQAGFAQDFQEKNDNGAVIYYKIFSAAKGYETLCLQDNSQKTNDFKYLLEEHDPQNRFQEWTLQPGDKEGTYLLRNRATYRYVSTSGQYIDDLYAITYTTKKDAVNQLLLTPLGNGQYAMTYTEGGTKRYMMVGDTEVGVEYFHRDNIYGTTRAWYIYPTTAIPSAVTMAQGDNMTVQVIRRKIVVTGVDRYNIFDIQGREWPTDTEFSPGIYTVQAGETIKTISVQ